MDDRLASIDLGSNTFRLSIGRMERHGDAIQLYTEDKLRELVALANGLDEHKHIDDATIEQALATLRRFGERLQGFAPAIVRAVATSGSPGWESTTTPASVHPNQRDGQAVLHRPHARHLRSRSQDG